MSKLTTIFGLFLFSCGIYAGNQITAEDLASSKCKSVLKGSPFVDKSVREFSEPSMTRSVEMAGSVTIDGLVYRLLRSTGVWKSIHQSEDNAFMGDPRAMAIAAGGELAYFLGFKYIDAKSMLVPDAVTFQTTLNRLNKKLIEQNRKPVPVKFFEPETSKVDDMTYLKNWADAGLIPLAQSGDIAIHDLSYHALAILLPHDYLIKLQQHTRRLLHFLNFAETKVNEEKDYQLLANAKVLEALIKIASNNLDVATANIATLLEAKFIENEVSESLLGYQLLSVSFGSDSDRQLLSYYAGTEYFLFSAVQDKRHKSKILFSLRKLIQTYKKTFPAHSIIGEEVQGQWLPEQLMADILARIAELQEAARELSKP